MGDSDLRDDEEVDDDIVEAANEVTSQERPSDEEYFGRTKSPFVGTDKRDENSSDFTARILADIMAQDPKNVQMQSAPKGGVDQFGQDLKWFKCRRCGTEDHIDPYMYEIMNRHGVLCLPCHVPHLYGWKLDRETGEKYLFPKPAGQKPRSRLGENERRELQNKVSELIDLKIRRDYIVETMLKLQKELTDVEPRIADLTSTVIPEATVALERIETDPMLEKKQESADILHDLGSTLLAMAKLKAKKAQLAAKGRK